MQITPDWLANIHPIIIHFPIALIFTAVLFDFFGLINSHKEWLNKGAILLFVLGALGLLAAFLSGQYAAAHLSIPKSLYPALKAHSEWAERTLFFFGFYAAFRLIIMWWNKQRSHVISIIVFLIGFAGLFLIYETGVHGGNLVYNHGVGTNPFIIRQKQRMRENHFKGPDTPTVMKNGGWSWEPTVNGPSILESSFDWIIGSAADLRPAMQTTGTDTVLDLKALQKPDMFIFKNPFADAEVTIRYNADKFDGSLSIVYHVLNAGNYQFMTLSKNQLAQGSVTDGNRAVLAKSQVTTKNGFQVMQVVIAGNDIYGKLNKEAIIHTHAASAVAGSVGLRIEGTGTLQLQYMAAMPLVGSVE